LHGAGFGLSSQVTHRGTPHNVGIANALSGRLPLDQSTQLGRAAKRDNADIVIISAISHQRISLRETLFLVGNI
jgi:hypothetical protein